MNSHITNLYPKPTSGVTAMKMLTVSSSPVQLTDSYTFDTRTKYITLDVQDNDVYVTYTGETPSASVGHILYAGNSYTWSVATARAAKFVQVGNGAVIAASQFAE
jgi:azurin